MIYIALGANMDASYNHEITKPAHTFLRCVSHLSKMGVHLKTMSGLWQSPAWPDPFAQPAYINAVIGVETQLLPQELLHTLKSTECDFGRTPRERNAARPLDLDILDYNREKISTEALTLPHPRMCNRSFVLFPLEQIAPHWRDPIKNRTITDWIARLNFEDVEHLHYKGKWPTVLETI
ncbi:MAG: 2-amino-4-hydroxy-6-hydroxymethyldihydropteridine diphosphokinase [Robiginitomaculum sp.]|nr:MAG: 2-amino-4-hydroxy-6-hydroxymethyldihydropteridine diphosphokinase [Robiginitomaculum sp.]